MSLSHDEIAEKMYENGYFMCFNCGKYYERSEELTVGSYSFCSYDCVSDFYECADDSLNNNDEDRYE